MGARNRLIATSAPYGEQGVRITVESDEDCRVRVVGDAVSAWVEMTVTEADALDFAAGLLFAAGRRDLAEAAWEQMAGLA